MSPTARSLKHLRELGMTAEVVECFNCFSRTKRDLFNVIDIVAVDGDGVLGIQATSGDNKSARVKKAKAEAKLVPWLRSGSRFEVWSFRRSARTRRYELTRTPVTLGDVTTPPGDGA